MIFFWGKGRWYRRVYFELIIKIHLILCMILFFRGCLFNPSFFFFCKLIDSTFLYFMRPSCRVQRHAFSVLPKQVTDHIKKNLLHQISNGRYYMPVQFKYVLNKKKQNGLEIMLFKILETSVF